MKKVKVTEVKAVFGYVRVSTLAQVTDGFSIQTQKALISDYVKKIGLTEGITWIEDQAVSASKFSTRKRAGFKTILANAKRGDYVIAARLDRIFRSVGDAAICLETLKGAGVNLCTTDKGSITGGDAAANLSLNVLTSVAQFESDLRSQRIREVKNYMAENLLWIGGTRKRGFSSATIGKKKFTVALLAENKVLQFIAKIKQQRESKLTVGRQRLSYESGVTVKQIEKSLVEFAKKNGIAGVEKKFSRATIYRLLKKDDGQNVTARLKIIKDSEKRILRVDGKFVLAKDGAKTSRRIAAIEGGLPGEGKQLSLLSGFRDKQEKVKVVSTRIR
jgi:DNA invertase Pin-like site-specific DNA recombinase